MAKNDNVVTVRFSKELMEKLQAEAKARGMSVPEFCKQTINGITALCAQAAEGMTNEGRKKRCPVEKVEEGSLFDGLFEESPPEKEEKGNPDGDKGLFDW
jgi:hypothetical protein